MANGGPANLLKVRFASLSRVICYVRKPEKVIKNRSFTLAALFGLCILEAMNCAVQIMEKQSNCYWSIVECDYVR